MTQIVQKPEGNDENPAAVKSYQEKNLKVSQSLMLGIHPKLILSWIVPPEYWDKGFSLRIFRNTTGFCPTRYPDDHSEHGHLIVESFENSSHEEYPDEGTYYFTCVLHRVRFGLWEKLEMVRFAVTIPSAKTAIGRMKDKHELQDLMAGQKFKVVENKAKLNEAKIRLMESEAKLNNSRERNGLPLIEDKEVHPEVKLALHEVDAIVDAFIAKRQKIAELENDPRFKLLSRSEQKQVMSRIQSRFNAGEIGARSEMRGN